jgi:FixJ family two-component response regulator
MEVAGWDEVALFLCSLRRDLGLRCELIFVSGRGDLDLRIEAAQFGAAGFLVWPGQAEDLPSLVSALESL